MTDAETIGRLRDTIRTLRAALLGPSLSTFIQQVAHQDDGIRRLPVAIGSFFVRYDEDTNDLCLMEDG